LTAENQLRLSLPRLRIKVQPLPQVLLQAVILNLQKRVVGVVEHLKGTAIRLHSAVVKVGKAIYILIAHRSVAMKLTGKIRKAKK